MVNKTIIDKLETKMAHLDGETLGKRCINFTLNLLSAGNNREPRQIKKVYYRQHINPEEVAPSKTLKYLVNCLKLERDKYPKNSKGRKVIDYAIRSVS